MHNFIATSKRFSALNIDSIGHTDDIAHAKYGPATRPEHAIFYVVKGSGYFNNIRVNEGQGFIHVARTLGEYHPDAENPWTLLWFATHDNNIEYLYKYYNLDENFIFDYDFVDELTPLFTFLKDNDRLFVNRPKMLEIYMGILAKHIPLYPEYSSASNERRYIEYAESYIRRNYHSNISVTSLAEFLGVSQPYLFNIFKRFFGLSPKQFIVNFRINLAKELLLDTDLQVNIIAKSVGYADARDFTKIFSKKAGMSPLKYRATERK